MILYTGIRYDSPEYAAMIHCLLELQRNIITFSHKDGAKTITLEDIETALAEAGFGFG